MKIVKKILKILFYLLLALLVFLAIICLWHHISNAIEKRNISIPGNKIKIYENEYIHASKMGKGDYTIVLLPGMGTAIPYYDYWTISAVSIYYLFNFANDIFFIHYLLQSS